MWNLKEVKSDLVETTGDTPTFAAWAENAGLSIQELKQALDAGKRARAKNGQVLTCAW